MSIDEGTRVGIGYGEHGTHPIVTGQTGVVKEGPIFLEPDTIIKTPQGEFLVKEYSTAWVVLLDFTHEEALIAQNFLWPLDEDDEPLPRTPREGQF